MIEIKQCIDQKCNGYMDLITFRKGETYTYTLCICRECHSICKEDLCKNAGQLWIMKNGRVYHYNEDGSTLLSYFPPGVSDSSIAATDQV